MHRACLVIPTWIHPTHTFLFRFLSACGVKTGKSQGNPDSFCHLHGVHFCQCLGSGKCNFLASTRISWSPAWQAQLRSSCSGTDTPSHACTALFSSLSLSFYFFFFLGFSPMNKKKINRKEQARWVEVHRECEGVQAKVTFQMRVQAQLLDTHGDGSINSNEVLFGTKYSLCLGKQREEDIFGNQCCLLSAETTINFSDQVFGQEKERRWEVSTHKCTNVPTVTCGSSCHCFSNGWLSNRSRKSCTMGLPSVSKNIASVSWRDAKAGDNQAREDIHSLSMTPASEPSDTSTTAKKEMGFLGPQLFCQIPDRRRWRPELQNARTCRVYWVARSTRPRRVQRAPFRNVWRRSSQVEFASTPHAEARDRRLGTGRRHVSWCMHADACMISTRHVTDNVTRSKGGKCSSSPDRKLCGKSAVVWHLACRKLHGPQHTYRTKRFWCVRDLEHKTRYSPSLMSFKGSVFFRSPVARSLSGGRLRLSDTIAEIVVKIQFISFYDINYVMIYLPRIAEKVKKKKKLSCYALLLGEPTNTTIKN